MLAEGVKYDQFVSGGLAPEASISPRDELAFSANLEEFAGDLQKQGQVALEEEEKLEQISKSPGIEQKILKGLQTRLNFTVIASDEEVREAMVQALTRVEIEVLILSQSEKQENIAGLLVERKLKEKKVTQERISLIKARALRKLKIF